MYKACQNTFCFYERTHIIPGDCGGSLLFFVCVCVCVLILQEKLRIVVLVSKAAFQSIQGEVVSNLVN